MNNVVVKPGRGQESDQILAPSLVCEYETGIQGHESEAVATRGATPSATAVAPSPNNSLHDYYCCHK